MPSVFKTVLFSLFVTAGVQAAPAGHDEVQKQDETSGVVTKMPLPPLPLLWFGALRELPPDVRDDTMATLSDPTYWIQSYLDEYGFHVQPLEESAGHAAVNVQPLLDYDTDSCYNVAAVDKNGTISNGLPKDGDNSFGCRSPKDLDRQNVYSRTRCNNGWCAHMYEHFFEKDVALDWLPFWGHRYDWENIVVVTKQGTSDIEFVCVSQHGDYECNKARDVRFKGKHPKVIYHKDGALTHCFRFARADDERLENAKGEWIRGPLIDWNMWPDNNVRDKMVHHFRSEFSTVRPKLSDDDFKTHLRNAVSDRILGFDVGKDE